MTYSINTGTSTQATTYDIVGNSSIDFTDVLTDLYDNKNKEITPEVIRNSILTILSTSALKETTSSQSNIPYIGIDSLNPINSEKDIKRKIYFGKRSYSGTYSYSSSHDIMSTEMLNRNDDIFFFNTKRDTVSNNRTRLSILSGNDFSLFKYPPYIQSQKVIFGTYSSLSLDISNETLSGGTNSTLIFKSIFGTVSVNNIVFPSIQDSYNNASNNKILTWSNGLMTWQLASFSSTNYIGTTGSPINIQGYPVKVNNYSIEFTDDRPCPIEIGDIKFGEKFNSESIYEMLTRIIYPYLPPKCSLSIDPPFDSGYVEIGTSPSIKLSYTITKRTLPTLATQFSYMLPSIYPPITNSGQVLITGSASGVVITPVSSKTASFSVSVSDGTQSNTATASIRGVYPYFYGFSSVNPITNTGLLQLSKLIEPHSDKTVEIFGSGNLYFIYDYDYPDLSYILNDVGVTVSNYFSYSVLTLSSPTGLWASKKFKVYQWNNHPFVSPSVSYQFRY